MAQKKQQDVDMSKILQSPWKEEKCRAIRLLLVKVLSCILIALLFLVAVFDPGFGKTLACLGVIVSCSLAAVFTDRHFGR